MEKNESNSTIKSVENRLSNNGRLAVSANNNNNNNSKDDRINIDLSYKKSCVVVSHSSEGSNTTLAGCSTGGNSSSHKMGSRRIFTPQFKLQVLESYRNDNDCKGNQRATARKYNIHRRQIQKWLQCESSLRSSVANINQNTVKHQFHNISMHQQQTHKSSIPGASLIGSVPYGASSQHSHLDLDATRPEMTNNSMIMPSLSTGVTTPSTQTRGAYSAVNLAAVVAAAAGAAMTVSNPPSSDISVPNETVASPSRPSTIIGAKNSSPRAAMSPLLHHHHHHYGIAPYMHTPANVQLPVPILTHHISHPQPIHQQDQQYQYHHLTYTHLLTHQSDKQQSSFLSPITLPAASLNGFSLAEPELTEPMDPLRHATSKTSSEQHALNDASCGSKLTYFPKTINPSLYPFGENGYPLVYPLCPMDLSVRPRRNTKTELSSMLEKTDVSDKVNTEADYRIVDLTHRKRKVSDTSNSTAEIQTTEVSEKQLKLQNYVEGNNYGSNANSDEDEVDIEVGIEEKLPPSKPVKLFKPYLLDDDGDDDADADTDNSTASSCRSSETKCDESGDRCSWLRCAPSHSPPPRLYDISNSYQGTTFQNSLKENFTTQIESSDCPLESKAEISKSAFSPIPAISPCCFRSPKASPSSSGYESSSSTYSESSFSSRADSFALSRTYNMNLQMHAIHSDALTSNSSNHVERWLEQEARYPSEPNSPIAILA